MPSKGGERDTECSIGSRRHKATAGTQEGDEEKSSCKAEEARGRKDRNCKEAHRSQKKENEQEDRRNESGQNEAWQEPAQAMMASSWVTRRHLCKFPAKRPEQAAREKVI